MEKENIEEIINRVSKEMQYMSEAADETGVSYPKKSFWQGLIRNELQSLGSIPYNIMNDYIEQIYNAASKKVN